VCNLVLVGADCTRSANVCSNTVMMLNFQQLQKGELRMGALPVGLCASSLAD